MNEYIFFTKKQNLLIQIGIIHCKQHTGYMLL